LRNLAAGETKRKCNNKNKKGKPKTHTHTHTHTHTAVLDIYAKVAQDLIYDSLVPKQVSRSSKNFQSYATPKSCKKAH
jgi:hypothetical protein